MACGRPGGFSDSEDSDDDFFYEKPSRRAAAYLSLDEHELSQKTIENDLTAAISAGDLDNTVNIINTRLRGNVNSRLPSGWTALLHASFHAQDHIVERLLDNGADVNLHGGSTTPLMAICRNETADESTVVSIVRRLLGAGALVNLGDMSGMTALMWAISTGRGTVVASLLQHGGVNIEMRDQHGWTAAFWAVYHNCPDILSQLMERDARLGEVDRNGRTLLDIATVHDHTTILDMLRDKMGLEQEEPLVTDNNNNPGDWMDYYPVLKEPDYKQEISKLLYGMRCERLYPAISQAGLDLKQLLLLTEASMLALDIRLPYERKRLRVGIRRFHTRGWKADAVAGLYAQQYKNYSVLDCLTTLGSHLQQVYILDATLHYSMRLDPAPDPGISTAARCILNNITNIRREITTMHSLLNKISSNNLPPADLIREPPASRRFHLSTLCNLVIVSSLGVALYTYRNTLRALFKR